MDVPGVARAVGGALLLGYLPGLLWSFVLLPDARGLVRHVLAVGLSLAFVTLAIFLANAFLSVALSGPHAAWIALALCLGALAALSFARVQARLESILRG